MEVEFCHSLEDTTDSLFVGLRVGGGDEEVIHVDDKPSFSDHVPEGVVHESLEHGGGVAKAEKHDSGFKESLVGNEGGLPLVTIFDLDIVVSPMDIELGEMVNIFELVHKVRDEGEGVCVTGGMPIEIVVVLAWA